MKESWKEDAAPSELLCWEAPPPLGVGAGSRLASRGLTCATPGSACSWENLLEAPPSQQLRSTELWNVPAEGT